jgi:hypothetical protein
MDRGNNATSYGAVTDTPSGMCVEADTRRESSQRGEGAVRTMATTGCDRPPGSEDDRFVTSCGRRIAVRRLRFAATDRPITRVALDVGRDQGGEPGVWAALTAGEARDLARLLLLQADLAERSARPVGPGCGDSSAPC